MKANIEKLNYYISRIFRFILPKFSSRRERMTYWVFIFWLVLGIVCVRNNVSLLDASVYMSPIVAVAGWYLQKETESSSKLDM